MAARYRLVPGLSMPGRAVAAPLLNIDHPASMPHSWARAMVIARRWLCVKAAVPPSRIGPPRQHLAGRHVGEAIEVGAGEPPFVLGAGRCRDVARIDRLACVGAGAAHVAVLPLNRTSLRVLVRVRWPATRVSNG